MGVILSDSSSRRVYVVGDQRAGDFRVDQGSMGRAQMIAAGAGLGSSFGPWGTVIGTAGATVGSFFGLGSKATDVRNVMRSAFSSALTKVLPGQIRQPGPGFKHVDLAGEYTRADMKKLVDTIKAQLLTSVAGADSDTRGDVTRFVQTIQFIESVGPPSESKYDILFSFKPREAPAELAERAQQTAQANDRISRHTPVGEKRSGGAPDVSKGAEGSSGPGGFGGLSVLLLAAIGFLAIRS